MLVVVGPPPRLADPTAPLLRADDLAVLRGEGVFETARVGQGRVVLLDEHLERFAGSASRVGIALPAAGDWRAAAALAVQAWGRTSGTLRLVCTKGPDGAPPVGYALLTAIPAASRAAGSGLHAVSLTLGVAAGTRADAPWLLGGVKSTSYAVAMASLRAAAEAGAQDAVWVSSDGEVLEAPTATVAWVEGDVLVAPPDDTGVLPGTTLLAVARLATDLGVQVRRERGSVDRLRGADEAAFLSSVRGVVPLLSLDGTPVGAGVAGPVISRLRSAYEALCDGPGAHAAS